MQKAVILFSGGIDSATILAIAKSRGYACYALTFDYGQRHHSEIEASKIIAKEIGVIAQRIFPLAIGTFGHSALTNTDIDLPDYTQNNIKKITCSYVPARNTIFLSIALTWAETLQAQNIFFGGCKADAAGFPDCRATYLTAFEKMANLSTQSALEGRYFIIHKPLIELSKGQTIRLGTQLGVDYRDTVTCYQANAHGEACGYCESCGIRKQGFIDAGVADMTRYANATSKRI